MSWNARFILIDEKEKILRFAEDDATRLVILSEAKDLLFYESSMIVYAGNTCSAGFRPFVVRITP